MEWGECSEDETFIRLQKYAIKPDSNRRSSINPNPLQHHLLSLSTTTPKKEKNIYYSKLDYVIKKEESIECSFYIIIILVYLCKVSTLA